MLGMMKMVKMMILKSHFKEEHRLDVGCYVQKSLFIKGVRRRLGHSGF